MNTEKLLLMCPLDSAHMIQKHKMQTHLVKCVRNHDMSKKSVCPYNSTHIVDKIVYEDHVSICPDAKSLVQFQYVPNAAPLKGVLSVEEFIRRQNNLQNDHNEEDWGCSVRNGPAYDPTKNIENKNILIPVAVMSKSQRKAHRESERLRHARLENVNATASRNTVPGYTPVKTTKSANRKPQDTPKMTEPNVETKSTMMSPKSGATKEKPSVQESTSQEWEVVKPRSKATKSNSEDRKNTGKVIKGAEDRDDEVNKMAENLSGMKIKPCSSSSSKDEIVEKNVGAEEDGGLRIGRRCAANFGLPFSDAKTTKSVFGIGRGHRIAAGVSKTPGLNENSSAK